MKLLKSCEQFTKSCLTSSFSCQTLSWSCMTLLMSCMLFALFRLKNQLRLINTGRKEFLFLTRRIDNAGKTHFPAFLHSLKKCCHP